MVEADQSDQGETIGCQGCLLTLEAEKGKALVVVLPLSFQKELGPANNFKLGLLTTKCVIICYNRNTILKPHVFQVFPSDSQLYFPILFWLQSVPQEEKLLFHLRSVNGRHQQAMGRMEERGEGVCSFMTFKAVLDLLVVVTLYRCTHDSIHNSQAEEQ